MKTVAYVCIKETHFFTISLRLPPTPPPPPQKKKKKVSETFNFFPNDKILDWSKLKAFADDKLNVAKMTNSPLIKQKTLWVKEKMLVTSTFSFSHNVFKILLSQGCKVLIVW